MPANIRQELKSCADTIADTDNRMQKKKKNIPGFVDYSDMNFENKVRDKLNFKDVTALNPNYIGPVINNLKEEKIGVIPFD